MKQFLVIVLCLIASAFTYAYPKQKLVDVVSRKDGQVILSAVPKNHVASLLELIGFNGNYFTKKHREK